MANVHRLSEEELLKLKAAALYVIEKCGEIDYFHLFKILYFADCKHYAVYGRRIIKDTFCALPKGPVPSNLYNAVKDAIGSEKLDKMSPLKGISDILYVPDETYSYILSAKEKPDMDELSMSDTQVLDESIHENQNIPFSVLSEKSHDIAWHDADDRKPNSEIDSLMMAKAGGASDDTIAFIKENDTFDNLLN